MYELGPFRLDPRTGVLTRGDRPVALGARAVAVLKALVEHPREHVPKQRILESAAQDAAHFRIPDVSPLKSIGQIETPVYLAHGYNDRIVPFEVGLRLRRTLPNSTLRLVEGCGHMPQEEQPDATLGLLESFIGG